MQPSSPRDWAKVSLEREQDAEVLLRHRSNSSSPAYMVGYALEAALKGLISALGETPKKIHAIDTLWRDAGLDWSTLGDRDGHREWFLRGWVPDLRYEVDPPHGKKLETLLSEGRQLSDWIRKKIDRALSINNRRMNS